MSGGDGYLTNPLYREIAALMTQAGIPFRVEQGAKHFHVKFTHLGVERTQILHLGPNNKRSTARKTVIRFRKIVASERAYREAQSSPQLNLEQPAMVEPACAMSPIYKLIAAVLNKENIPFTIEPRSTYDRLIVATRIGEKAISIHRNAAPQRKTTDKAEMWLHEVVEDRRYPSTDAAHSDMRAQTEMEITPPAPTTRLEYQGFLINQSGEMISLTDMWKAAGGVANREPFNWARKEGESFIEAVSVAHNLPSSQVMAAKSGKGGGTFAHWQIAIAYAKYLSPAFHMWANGAVREKMERMRAAPQAIEPPRSTAVEVFDPRPVTSSVIGGLINFFNRNVIGPIDRLVGAVRRVEAQQDNLLARIAENQGWLKERLENQHQREREMLHLLRYQNGGDPTKHMDVISNPDMSGYVDVHGIYELAGVTGKIPNRGLLSSIVSASLNAFCRDNPPYSVRSRPGRGGEKIAIWPKAAASEWLVSHGREMIERHLRAHSPKAELLPFKKPTEVAP